MGIFSHIMHHKLTPKESINLVYLYLNLTNSKEVLPCEQEEGSRVNRCRGTRVKAANHWSDPGTKSENETMSAFTFSSRVVPNSGSRFSLEIALSL